MTMPISTSNASDPWEMALIHRLIRRGFEQAAQAVLSPGSDTRVDAVAEYIAFHLDGLHAHHSTEDELLWPSLRERAGMSSALIGRMEGQHGALHDALDSTRQKLAAWRARPTDSSSRALASALEIVLDRLGEHLAEEERDVVPLISAHVTQAEWDHLGKTAFEKFTPQQRFTAMGELLGTATPTEAARMMAGLPAPIRVIWRLVGRRKYERFITRVQG